MLVYFSPYFLPLIGSEINKVKDMAKGSEKSENGRINNIMKLYLGCGCRSIIGIAALVMPAFGLYEYYVIICSCGFRRAGSLRQAMLDVQRLRRRRHHLLQRPLVKSPRLPSCRKSPPTTTNILGVRYTPDKREQF